MSEELQNTSTEDQLQELKRRYELLQEDRKTHYENSKSAIKENKETAQNIKKENKDLRAQLAQLKKEYGLLLNNSEGYKEREKKKLEKQVVSETKKHDDLKFQAKAKQKQLCEMEDSMRGLEKEAEPILTEDSPLTMKIRQLENKLDKAMIKYNEAQSIKKTYEQIEKRLTEEKMGFDNQLQSIENTLKVKEQDYQELLKKEQEALKAREAAKNELEEWKKQYEEDSKDREKELKERKNFVALRLQETERMEERQAQHQKFVDTLEGSKNQEESGTQGYQIDEEKAKETKEQLEFYENAFRKLKEATGVTEVNDVIQKFMTQEDTYNSLVEMKSEALEKLEMLNQQKSSIKSELEELKYSGSSTVGSRRMIDEYEAELATANVDLERNKQKYERVAKMLIDVQAGIESLAENINMTLPEENNGEEEQLKQIDTEKSGPIQMIHDIENRLTEMLNDVGDDIDNVEPPESEAYQDEMDLTSSSNMRINIPDIEASESEESEDEDEDVLDRDMVKKMASQTLERSTKKGKKKKRRTLEL